ncbi:hypothetical protein CR513_39135, partial [Mucuna pruriens]
MKENYLTVNYSNGYSVKSQALVDKKKKLKMRQRKWLEFLKSPPKKSQCSVVNALSRKSSCVPFNGYRDLRDSSLDVRVITHENRIGAKIRTNEVMIFYNKIHVLDGTKLRKLILQSGLSSGLYVPLRAARTYQNLREMFGWFGLKEERRDEPNCLAYPDQC